MAGKDILVYKVVSGPYTNNRMYSAYVGHIFHHKKFLELTYMLNRTTVPRFHYIYAWINLDTAIEWAEDIAILRVQPMSILLCKAPRLTVIDSPHIISAYDDFWRNGLHLKSRQVYDAYKYGPLLHPGIPYTIGCKSITPFEVKASVRKSGTVIRYYGK